MAASQPSSGHGGRPQRPPCAVCGSALREDSDGNLYCSSCGSLSQASLAEEAEYDASMAGTIGVRHRARKAADVDAGATRDELTWRVTQVFFRAVQDLLQLQCRVLVQAYQCPPELIPIVGRLWVVVLDHWAEQNAALRVRLTPLMPLQRLPPKVHTRRRRRKRRRARYDDEYEEDEYDADDADTESDGEEVTLEDHDGDEFGPVVCFPLGLTLALQLVGLSLVRCPVTARDLVAWADSTSPDARLPFFAALATLSPAVQALVLPHADLCDFFSPRRIWHAAHVRRYAHDTLGPLIRNRCVALVLVRACCCRSVVG